jgi:hypothetical protein
MHHRRALAHRKIALAAWIAIARSCRAVKPRSRAAARRRRGALTAGARTARHHRSRPARPSCRPGGRGKARCGDPRGRRAGRRHLHERQPPDRFPRRQSRFSDQRHPLAAQISVGKLLFLGSSCILSAPCTAPFAKICREPAWLRLHLAPRCRSPAASGCATGAHIRNCSA